MPKPAAAPMTSRAIVTALAERVGPMVAGQLFSVGNGEHGILHHTNDHVTLTWAQVPATASELEALNARRSVMLTIEAPEWHQTRVTADRIGHIPVTKVSVHAFRGDRRSFRAKTGTPEQVIAHIVGWFAAATDA